MRYIRIITTSTAVSMVVMLFVSGCTGSPPTPTPDPRVGQLEQLNSVLSEDISRLSTQIVELQATPTPISTPTPTPIPTPTPGPTLAEIEGVVAGSIAAAVGELPTPAPRPTAEDVRRAVQEGIAAYDASRPIPTPGPTLADIEGIVGERIREAIAGLPPAPTAGPTLAEVQALIDDGIADAVADLPPTPTPGPTAAQIQAMVTSEVAEAVSQLPSISIIPQTSASSRTSLTEDITLSVHPGSPVAGRDVQFTLEGLEPWASVEVEFVDPRNEPVEWVTDDEGHFTRVNGEPVTKHALHADGSGAVSWQRVATKDVEGIWTVQLDIHGVRHTVTYPVSQLQLSVQKVDTVGLEMRHYQGTVSDAYLASLVPATFAIDLQAHLDWTVRRLAEDYGLRSTQIPDIYLVGDEENLETIASVIGLDIGFEDGFYRVSNPRPGIYMRTDQFRTGVQRLLTHEYVHLIVGELSNGRDVPAWLNEGLADYVESKLGLESERPSVARLLAYRQMDDAKAAQIAGMARDLNALENQPAWNAETDDILIGRQYGKARMAVQYISQEFSDDAPIEIIHRISRGMSLSRAVQDVLGISYQELRQLVNTWITEWSDPEREEVRSYIEQMNSRYAALDEEVDRRNESLDDNLTRSQRAAVLREVVATIGDIQAGLASVTHPEPAQLLHEEFRTYVDTVVEWLTLERDYADTGQDRKRTDANDMLPEVNARGAEVWRSLNNLQYVYRVGRY